MVSWLLWGETETRQEIMLLSHRHGFLFVHVAKTGGTSVRAALSKGRLADPLAWPMILSSRISAMTGHRIGAKLPRHAGVIAAKEMLPPECFSQLFKFAFVRNPWDRLVSAYRHFERERQDVLQSDGIGDFPCYVEFILNVAPETTVRGTLVQAMQRPQLESLVGLGGELLVDFVGRYESLHEHFAVITERVGMPTLKLPHRRASHQTKDYREYFMDRLAEEVGTHFADDIQAFQYEFDGRESNSTESVSVRPKFSGPAIAGRIDASQPPPRGGAMP